MLKLIADVGKGSASIPLRWSIDNKTLEELKTRGAFKPHLLIVAVSDGLCEESRRLVPIEQMMEYVDFSRPGKFTISVAIVWNKVGSTRFLKKRILGGRVIDDNGKLAHFRRMSLLDCEGVLYLEDKGCVVDKACVCFFEETAQIDVNVADEFFAPKPSKFERFWVNFWFEREPRDQWQFCRRRMLAYTIQPPVVAAYCLIKTVYRCIIVLGHLLYGQRGINLRPIMHPWDMDNSDILSDDARCKGSIFLKKADGTNRSVILFPLMPLLHACIFLCAGVLSYTGIGFWRFVTTGEEFLLSIFAILYVLDKAGEHIDKNVLRKIRDVLIGVVPVVASLVLSAKYPWLAVTMALCAGALSLLYLMGEPERRRIAALSEEERRQWLLRREYAQYQMVARNGSAEAKLQALPRERQTFYLWYRDLKAKVCKPYAS